MYSRDTFRRFRPLGAVLLSIVSVQCGAAIAKSLFPIAGAATTAGLRIGISAVILLVAFRPPLGALTAAQWRAVLPYGVALGVMNLVFYEAIARIPLGLGVTLEFVGPLGVAVAGSRRLVDGLWVALAAIGIALIAPWSGQATASVDPVGVVFALAAGAGWAAYIVFGRRVAHVLPGGAAVATGMAIAAVVVLPFSIASGGLTHLTPSLFGAGAALALLSSAIPFTLEMYALGMLPSRTFSVLMSLEPAVAAVAGFVFLHERLTTSQWLATLLVIVASAGATFTSASREGA